MDAPNKSQYKNLYDEDNTTVYGSQQEKLYGGDLADVQLNEEDDREHKKQRYIKWGAAAGVVIFIALLIGLLASQGVFDKSSSNSLEFGHSQRSQFSLEKGYINLNHGSYGAVPKSVMSSLVSLQSHIESNPDRWFRYDLKRRQEAVIKRIATYVHANSTDIIFIPNAATGINSILRAMSPPSSSQNTILYVNTAYSMVKSILTYFNTRSDCQQNIQQVLLSFPTNSTEIVNTVVNALDANSAIYMVALDHVASVPALQMPIAEMIQACKQRGILVMVDGAHALGNIPLDIPSLGADFYLMNGHKWMYAPKGAALLWVRPAYQSSVYAFIPSPLSDASVSFGWSGATDYASYLTLDEAMNFRDKYGDAAVMEYMHNVSSNGGQLLAEMWGTEVLCGDDPFLTNISMVNVRLPIKQIPTVDILSPSGVSTQIYNRNNTWVPVFELQKQWWARLSAQIYNDESDFRFYGQAVIDLLSSMELFAVPQST